MKEHRYVLGILLGVPLLGLLLAAIAVNFFGSPLLYMRTVSSRSGL